MRQTFNFCAGPAMMPLDVLKQAQAELLDWQGLDASVMEISHRSAEFVALAKECEEDLRELMDIPCNYKVLFFQGGALAQFAFLPMNLLGEKKQIDFINTGSWSTRAMKEMQKYAKANVIYSGEESRFTTLPQERELKISEESAFLHLCANETIHGVEFTYDIADSPIPVVADMSSNILSRKVDVSKYGVIYAGAQKNIGPAGLTIVIIREDLLGNAMAITPDVFNYEIQAKNDSMLNTPPTFAIYLMSLVLKNLKARGGIESVEERNRRKAAILYDAIDSSHFYTNPVHIDARSKMNIPFILDKPELDATFLKEAEAAKLINLGGHRSVGGMRASLYNAMPVEGVVALTHFMKDFELKYA